MKETEKGENKEEGTRRRIHGRNNYAGTHTREGLNSHMQGHTRGRGWAGVSQTGSCPQSTQADLQVIHTHIWRLYTYTFTYTSILYTLHCIHTRSKWWRRIFGASPLSNDPHTHTLLYALHTNKHNFMQSMAYMRPLY